MLPNYRLYKFAGKFTVDYYDPNRPFGLHNLGVSLRHRSLTADSLIYVTDELGMGLTSASSFLEKMTRDRVFSSIEGWAPDSVRFFQDTMEADHLGDTTQLNGSTYSLAYSRFNFVIAITPESLSIRRLTPPQIAQFVTAILIAAILLTTVMGKWKRLAYFAKTLWFVQAMLWVGLLLVGETSVLRGLMGEIPDWHLTNVLKAFDVLWWLIPAVLLTKAIDLFVWIPLESRTERSIPSLVRRIVENFYYQNIFFEKFRQLFRSRS